MALGILMIIFIVLIVIGIIIQIFLYRSSNDSKHYNLIFIINMLFGILLSYLAYTSLPSNYIGQRILAGSWMIIAILAMLMKSKMRGSEFISKMMLTISIVGGFSQLYL